MLYKIILNEFKLRVLAIILNEFKLRVLIGKIRVNKNFKKI